MLICFLRHGEKENAYGPDRSDPSLTARGQAQALRLKDLVAKNQLPLPHQLFASKTKRTFQTLAALAEAQRLEVKSQDLLKQRSSKESSQDFQTRVQKALKWVEEFAEVQSDQVIYLCSHVDWLDEAYNMIPSSETLPFVGFWQPGQYFLFSWNQGLWQIDQHGIL